MAANVASRVPVKPRLADGMTPTNCARGPAAYRPGCVSASSRAPSWDANSANPAASTAASSVLGAGARQPLPVAAPTPAQGSHQPTAPSAATASPIAAAAR